MRLSISGLCQEDGVPLISSFSVPAGTYVPINTIREDIKALESRDGGSNEGLNEMGT